MKLSYTTLSVQDKTIGEAVETAVKYGLEGIELRGRNAVHVSPSCPFSYVSSVKRLTEQSGLSVPCLTAYTKFRQDSVQKVRAEVDELMEMVSLAEYLGAGCVRIFLGAYPEGHTREQSDSVATEGLCYAAEKMGSSPVKLVIETHDTGKCGRILGPLLRDVPPSVGVLLDIIHPWDMGEPIEETWRLIGDRIYHVHIKDIEASAENGRIYSRIGEGMLPVAETVDWLEGHGYDGFYSLEWEKSVEDRGVAFEDQLESFVQFMRGRK